MTIEEARRLCNDAKAAHESNETRGTEYRIGAGSVYLALRDVLAAIDAERAKVAEVTRERDLAQAAERTFALRLRLVHEALGDPECEVVLTSDLVARRIREAQEQGARWALIDWNDMHPHHARAVAARICAEARAKGGE